MRCSKAQRWISRRVDGALERRLEAALADHLARCAPCRAYADTLAGLNLDVLEAPEPTSDFSMRVMHSLAVMPRRRWSALRHPIIFRPVAAGLGVAAALGGFVVGSLIQLAGADGASPQNGIVELTAGEAVDPLAEDSVESVLIAMLSSTEE